ncbi:MAG: response regulator [Reyranella sp.]|uniref:response regulator n=1 Tax=Reyranella sp. TaxID=1929291 RepID=UPI003D1114A4
MTSVLLVEDEFLIRAVVVDALDGLNIACIEAASGQKAIEVIDSDVPLSVVIVDIGLPDMSGERVIEAALERRPAVAIIRCSGAEPAGPMPHPQVHVVAKPFSAVELAKLVASLSKGD